MLVEVRDTPGGRRVVAKQARTPDEAARLRHEAEVLEMARHPGVVDVLGLDGHPDQPVLLTSHVDGPTLAAADGLTTREVAGVLAAVAATLADLHSLGVVHGGVAAEHVLLAPDGSPVLCGFGNGGRTGEQSPGSSEPLDPPGDVFDLGLLVRSLSAPGSADGRALRRVAEEAVAHDPGERPTARALADSITGAVAGVRLPRVGGAGRQPEHEAPGRAPDPLDAWRRLQAPSPTPGVGRRRLAAVGGTVALVLVALVVTTSLGTGSPPATPLLPDEPVDGHEPPAATSGAPIASAPSSSRPPARSDCPAAPSTLAADVDGDGCSDPLRFVAGTVESGEHRWSVGRDGDRVATGDWACTGARTLALLRPSTGELFRFDRWAAAGAEVVVTAFTRVDGGVALRAADLDQDGCHEMVVERDVGPPEIVRPPRAAP